MKKTYAQQFITSVSGGNIYIQHCIICRTLDSTVTEDARIEPISATLAFAVTGLSFQTLSKLGKSRQKSNIFTYLQK